MVSKNTILISVHKDTKLNLDKLKVYKSICYNDAIVKLIDFWNIHHFPESSEFKVPIIPQGIVSGNTSTGN